MDLPEIIARLNKEPNRQVVSDKTGINYMYLSRLAWGKMKRPGMQKIDELRKYFRERDSK